MIRTTKRTVLGAVLFLALAGGAAEAAYPERPIRMIVPYAPGGASDVVTRILSQYLEKAIGQTVAIVNVDGGGGAVGWQQVVTAKPDGYTLTMYVDSIPVMESTKAVQFTQSDFEPVSIWGVMDLTVFTKAGGPLANLADMKKAALAAPGKVGLAMGHGTPSQFAAKIFEEALGAELNLVNVGAGAKKKAAVLGGHVDSGIEPMPGMAGDIRAGQFVILAVLSGERSKEFPDIPTAKEQGVDVVAYNTYGIIAPKGTPTDRLEVIDKAIAGIVKDPEFIEANRKVNFRVTYEDRNAATATMDAVRKRMLDTGKKLGF